MQDLLGSNFAARLAAGIADPVQNLALLGVVAAMALVVVSAFVKTMISLRWLAVASSVGFLIYGALQPSIGASHGGMPARTIDEGNCFRAHLAEWPTRARVSSP